MLRIMSSVFSCPGRLRGGGLGRVATAVTEVSSTLIVDALVGDFIELLLCVLVLVGKVAGRLVGILAGTVVVAFSLY